MYQALKATVHRTVNQYCEDPSHRDEVLRVLARPGLALDPEGQCRTGALALEVYRSVRGELAPSAWQAAAAMELYMEAGFLLDHVADDEIDPEYHSSPAEELVLAVSIMNCGMAAAHEAARLAPSPLAGSRGLRRLVRHCLSACAGQLQDARLARREAVTTQESLEMTALKAGSCGRAATSFAAAIATEDVELVELFGEFGFNLLTYSQLVDDLKDAWPDHSAPRDLVQGKKTVPLVFLRNSLSGAEPSALSGIMAVTTTAQIDTELRREFDNTGTREFGAVVAEAYLNSARRVLADLSARLGPLDNIERLVDAREFSPREVVAAQ